MATWLAVFGGVLVVIIALDRLLAVPLWHRLLPLACLAGALVAGVISWIIHKPGRIQVALLLDERLNLHERLSTSLALDDDADAFARASVDDACRMAEHLNFRQALQLGPFRRWGFTAAAWACAGLAFCLLPALDPLGLHEQSLRQQHQQAQARQAQQQIQQAARSVLAVAQQVKDPALSAELAAIEQQAASMPSDEMKRQAIRKLGDLAEGMKAQERSRQEMAQELNKMLGQLRSPPKAASPELSRALAKGDFAKAAELAKSLQQKVQSNEMNPEQKQALASQLNELAKQLGQLASEQKELQRELEKAGLEKNLSQLSPEDLKKALEQKQLPQEQIDKLMQKAAACKGACEKGGALAQAMGRGGDSASDDSALDAELAEMAQQLSELEAAKLDMEARLAAVRELERAKKCLGGNCVSPGEQSPWEEGLADLAGPGSGKPGIGMGQRDSADSGDFGLDKAKAPTLQGKGPAVASWFFKGEQLKGESQRDYQQVMQAARDNAAQAIKENEIPRKYEGPVKKYFGELESPPPGQ